MLMGVMTANKNVRRETACMEVLIHTKKSSINIAGGIGIVPIGNI